MLKFGVAITKSLILHHHSSGICYYAPFTWPHT